MTEVRWVCLLPDAVTGLDQPVEEVGSRRPKVWIAPNREYAVRLIRQDLLPNTFRLSSVVSYVDWLARKQTPQRVKLTDAQPPISLGLHPHEKNPRRICHRCFGPTGATGHAMYCPTCRHHGPAKGQGKNQNSRPRTAHAD